MNESTVAIALSAIVAVAFSLGVAVLSDRITVLGGLVCAALAIGLNAAIEIASRTTPNNETQSVDRIPDEVTGNTTVVAAATEQARAHREPTANAQAVNRATSTAETQPAAAENLVQEAVASTGWDEVDLRRYLHPGAEADEAQCPRCGRFDTIEEPRNSRFGCQTCRHRWQRSSTGLWPRTKGHPSIAATSVATTTGVAPPRRTSEPLQLEPEESL